MRNSLFSFIAILILSSIGCSRGLDGELQNSNNEVFAKTFDLINESLYGATPSPNSLYFYDTISIDKNIHEEAILGWLEYLPDSLPKEQVLELLREFGINRSSIDVGKIELPYSFSMSPLNEDSLLQLNDLDYKGTLRISNICYNEKETSAIFYVAFYCGNGCSKGGLAFVTKSEETQDWEKVEILEVWSSGTN